MSGDLSFVVFKYIPNLRRQEPRNVGVALIHSTGVHARFVGEGLPGDIDLRTVRPLIGDTGAYEQWVDYWRYHVEQGNASNGENASDALKELINSSRNNYIVVPGGRVLVPGAEDKDPNTLLSFLYNEVVETEDEPPLNVKIDLERTAAQLVKASGISRSPLFQQSPKIMVLNRKGVREKITPDYLIINRNYNVLESVSLHMTSESSARRALDATQYMYEKLEVHAKNENRKEAVFVSFIDARPERYTFNIEEVTTILQSWGPIVDVSQTDSSVKVLESILAAR